MPGSSPATGGGKRNLTNRVNMIRSFTSSFGRLFLKGSLGVVNSLSLTCQLLAFSRCQVLVPQLLDLNAVVSNLEKRMRRGCAR